jgi:hypothetical protein
MVMRDLNLSWRRVLAGSVAGAGLLSASTAGANQVAEAPAGPAAVSGVTVTAPEKPNPLVDKTTEFVRQRLPTSRFEQYARFRDPVCIKVAGLPDEFAAFVAKRIVEVAGEVHAPVAKDARCTPNINVIFAPAPQAQLTDIAKRREVLFGHYFKADTSRPTPSGPSRSGRRFNPGILPAQSARTDGACWSSTTRRLAREPDCPVRRPVTSRRRR